MNSNDSTQPLTGNESSFKNQLAETSKARDHPRKPSAESSENRALALQSSNDPVEQTYAMKTPKVPESKLENHGANPKSSAKHIRNNSQAEQRSRQPFERPPEKINSAVRNTTPPDRDF